MYYICSLADADRGPGATGEGRQGQLSWGGAMDHDDPMEAADGLDAMEDDDPAAGAAAAHVAAGDFATGVRFMWHRLRVQGEEGHWVWEACDNTNVCAVADDRVQYLRPSGHGLRSSPANFALVTGWSTAVHHPATSTTV